VKRVLRTISGTKRREWRNFIMRKFVIKEDEVGGA
jgi:hypothetical protein